MLQNFFFFFEGEGRQERKLKLAEAQLFDEVRCSKWQHFLTDQ